VDGSLESPRPGRSRGPFLINEEQPVTATTTSHPLGVLINKRASIFTDLPFGGTIALTNYSRHRPSGVPARLGLGFIDAIAAALQRYVTHVAFDSDGAIGRVTVEASGSSDVRHFSFAASADRIQFGGFAHSSGKPTYQIGIVALCHALARVCVGTPGGDEVAERWWQLLRALDTHSPRSTPTSGWGGNTVRTALSAPAIQPLVEQLADALEWFVRLSLPTAHEREITVSYGDIVPPGAALTCGITADELLALPTTARPSVVPAPAPTPAKKAARAVAPTTSVAAAPAVPTPAEPIVPPPAPPMTPDPTTPIFGPYIDRIGRTLQQDGARLFLVGPTATGKTFQAIQAATRLGWQIEIVVLDPGKDAQELAGGFTREQRPAALAPIDLESWGQLWQHACSWDVAALPEHATLTSRALAIALGIVHALRAGVRVLYLLLAALLAHLREEAGQDWNSVDGPVARWARQAASGTPTVLILDELARGHPSCVSFVMGLLNHYDRATVERQGLAIPERFAACSHFHIVDLWHTRERVVVPVTMARIVGTANLGDRYQGLDLADPAFRRRWDSWLHLSGYAADVQAQILGNALGIPPKSPLVGALTTVAAAVSAYQEKEDKLNATLDLATLITWGQAARANAAHGDTPALAFLSAAQDTWIDRVAPLKGDAIDPDVRTALVGFVQKVTPTAI
jgi:hypothetical protein